MRWLLFCLLTVAALAAATTVLEGRLQLELPPQFVELTATEIARKYPTTRPPKVAYANDRTHMTVSIAINLSDSKVKPNELASFGNLMQKMLTGGRAENTTHGLVQIKGRNWYRILFESQAVDQPVRNEIFLTPLGEQVIMVNFNSTLVEYPDYQQVLERAVQSMKVNDVSN